MNYRTSAAAIEKPRLVCRTIRLWSVVSGQPQSRHTATCADCRNYFAAIQNLESGLRRDAAVANSSPAPMDFAQQIIRTVRMEASASVHATSSSKSKWWTIGGLAIATSVALLVSLQFAPRSENRLVANPSDAEGAEVIVSAVQSLSSRLVDSVIPSAGELVATNPLQQELGLVYSDMRSALDFLALNFLPSSPASSVPAPARQI
jgi:hypothetical protein